MPVNDELGKRMKENYEQVPKYDMPILKGEDRWYLENLIHYREEE